MSMDEGNNHSIVIRVVLVDVPVTLRGGPVGAIYVKRSVSLQFTKYTQGNIYQLVV